MCGEKHAVPLVYVRGIGSPPRVRGKDVARISGVIAEGITPACAGKSDGGCNAVVVVEDHPRVCGEKNTGDWGQFFMEGSPPRVRGKVIRTAIWSAKDRITPACAGKRNGV